MPRDDKRPGRALGFGLPEPDAEPDDTSIKDALQSLDTKVDELLRKRGRPRDATADVLDKLREVGVLVLRDAIEHVQEGVPLSVLVAVNLPAIMDQLVKAFEQRLAVALKAGSAWHYKNQRKVQGDPARAERSARRRRNKVDLSD